MKFIARPKLQIAAAASRIAKSIRGLALMVLTLSFAGSVWADSRGPLTVLRVFSEGATSAGFYPNENIQDVCKWNLIYLDMSTPSGRGMFALLMQAKAQSLSLVRVDFVRNSDTTCTLTGLHIQ